MSTIKTPNGYFKLNRLYNNLIKHANPQQDAQLITETQEFQYFMNLNASHNNKIHPDLDDPKTRTYFIGILTIGMDIAKQFQDTPRYNIYSDLYDAFIDHTPPAERNNLVKILNQNDKYILQIETYQKTKSIIKECIDNYGFLVAGRPDSPTHIELPHHCKAIILDCCEGTDLYDDIVTLIETSPKPEIEDNITMDYTKLKYEILRKKPFL